jgi:transcriptional antiterminator NusG
MPYFTVHLKTNSEDEYIARAEPLLDGTQARLIWLRRSLQIRKKGEWKNSLAPIFPGYLFIEADEVSPELYLKLSRIPGFFRFLQSNENIVPLSQNDRELISYFLSFGQVVDKSVVYFDEGKRIRVVSGPLKELEGHIVKVDRRKERAKVRLDMFKHTFLIDFGFEAMEKA